MTKKMLKDFWYEVKERNLEDLSYIIYAITQQGGLKNQVNVSKAVYMVDQIAKFSTQHNKYLDIQFSMNVQYRKDKMRKQKVNNDIVNNIDETIIETCKWLNEKLHTGSRESETIKALADLVKARYLIGHNYFLSDSSPKE